MSELIESPRPKLTIGVYQRLVLETRLSKDKDDDWADKYADFLSGELVEFLTQHGDGFSILLPSDVVDPQNFDIDLRHHLADELGDLLWFGADIANRLGVNVEDVCTESLQRYTGIATLQTSLNGIQDKAIEHADEIAVVNKMGLYYPDSDSIHKTTTLAQNPNYVFMRTANRLRRSLTDGRNDMMPPSATELEPITDIKNALGDYLIVLAYVSKVQLGIDIEDVAHFNIAKLKNRMAHGKANDIEFDKSYTT